MSPSRPGSAPSAASSADNREGNGWQDRQRNYDPKADAESPALYPARRVLPLPDEGNLRRLHEAMSAFGDRPERKRQRGVRRLHRHRGPADFQATLRLRQVHYQCSLRERHSGPLTQGTRDHAGTLFVQRQGLASSESQRSRGVAGIGIPENLADGHETCVGIQRDKLERELGFIAR
jgi:hypothetical protein